MCPLSGLHCHHMHLEGFNRASNLCLCASLMCPSCTSVSRSVRSAAAVVEISMQPVVKITIATNFSAHLHRCVCSLLEPAIMSCEWEVGARDSEKHHAILLTSPSFISPACLVALKLSSWQALPGK
ncbi:hypothetical protein CY35_18G001900 [Sphagnum magellanicum]|nr:hypothetical protein CY35_18G001900 [Sphagnum magellanicum]KAH9532519.1 hypothetical protein CY35_18G001900 [Sphagnum magellanicum]